MAKSRNNKSNTTTVVKDAPKRKAQNSKVKASTQKQKNVLTKSNRSSGSDKMKSPAAATGGRGGSKGKGGSKSTKNTKKQAPKKPLTAEELDKQMDDYMMRNEKTAEKILEDQMDDYWAKKGKTDGTEAAKDEGEVNE
jgi:C-terminal duplication domain of Friend of PRMT1